MAGARWWQVALAGGLLAGCATHGGVTTAHPIGEGNVQVGLEPGAAVGAGGGQSAVLPTFNVAVRYGLSERAEIGGRLGTSAYEILGKVQLNTPGSDMPISIAPSGHFVAFGAGGASAAYAAYQVPLLIGVPMGESQLVVGPKLKQHIFVGGGGGASAGGTVISGGGVVAYSLKAGDKFRFHPEVSFDVPFLGAVGGSAGGQGGGGAAVGAGGALIGFNLGLLFGGD